MLDLQDKRFEAVFISDLHLHPQEPLISARFEAFINWAALNTKSVYILGDLFHAWAGDDTSNHWSRAIAKRLQWLSTQVVSIYYMHGNRDFLLGEDFAKSAGMIILSEPTVINLENNRILLVHGDRYCINDKAHQWFRRLTRNSCFIKIFLLLPMQFRTRMVNAVRNRSQANNSKTPSQMDVVQKPILAHMDKNKATILIHGHTHKPGLIIHRYNNRRYRRFVLSDWDDSPKLLCYYKTKGLEYAHDICLEE